MPHLDPVLSVPAGKTYDLILEHFIYSCPDTEPFKHESTNFITFRTAEGKMERIFGILGTVTLNPIDIEATFSIPEDLRDRIKGYVGVARNRGVMKHDGEYRFYILRDDAVVDLPHTPSTLERLPGPAYFTIDELTRGDQTVTPDH
jgi:hypothetical protein